MAIGSNVPHVRTHACGAVKVSASAGTSSQRRALIWVTVISDTSAAARRKVTTGGGHGGGGDADGHGLGARLPVLPDCEKLSMTTAM